MKKRFSYITLFAVCLSVMVLVSPPKESDSVTTLSKFGSTGEEVRKIQQVLKDWGLYNGAIDGIYGSQTQKAVRKFQEINGLVVDGIAGKWTLMRMGIQSASSGGGGGGGTGVINYSDYEYHLLAKCINGEARGEPYSGQVAVGAVIVNRVRHPSFPGSIASVIYQPGAFSSIVDGQIDAEVVESSRRAARDALNGVDPTNGAVYFYNPDKTNNAFMTSLQISQRIGKHVFALYQ